MTTGTNCGADYASYDSVGLDFWAVSGQPSYPCVVGCGIYPDGIAWLEVRKERDGELTVAWKGSWQITSGTAGPVLTVELTTDPDGTAVSNREILELTPTECQDSKVTKMTGVARWTDGITIKVAGRGIP